MKPTIKIALLSCAVAMTSSVVTVMAINHSLSHNDSVPAASTTYDSPSAGGARSAFLPVVQNPGTDTDFTKAAESTINGVVSIKSYATVRQNAYNGGDMFNDPLFEFFFGTPQRRQQPRRQQQQPHTDSEENLQPRGLGSGVIITSDGYIATNNHVIDGADKLEITLNDNRTFNATVIGTDPNSDLALIKIDATDLPVIPMGDSENLKVGEWVLAVGNPFGFTSTVTTGIVSAKARSISSVTHTPQMGLESYIQTDAAVNPGNSGGALVNLNGELVGINTAIYSQTGNYAGYSFAIPTSIVTKVMTDLKEYGTVQRAMLGVQYTELNATLAKDKGITAVNDGVLVIDVNERSSAQAAGLQSDDVIIAINGLPTRNSAQMMEQMSKYRPGDKVEITYVRDNKEHKVTTTLLNNLGSTEITAPTSVSSLGATFEPAKPDVLKQLGIRSGLQVTKLTNGAFKAAGVKEGLIILDINNARVSSADDVEKIYKAIMKDDNFDKVMFITGMYPTGKKVYYAVDLIAN